MVLLKSSILGVITVGISQYSSKKKKKLKNNVLLIINTQELTNLMGKNMRRMSEGGRDGGNVV